MDTTESLQVRNLRDYIKAIQNQLKSYENERTTLLNELNNFQIINNNMRLEIQYLVTQVKQLDGIVDEKNLNIEKIKKQTLSMQEQLNDLQKQLYSKDIQLKELSSFFNEKGTFNSVCQKSGNSQKERLKSTIRNQIQQQYKAQIFSLQNELKQTKSLSSQKDLVISNLQKSLDVKNSLIADKSRLLTQNKAQIVTSNSNSKLQSYSDLQNQSKKISSLDTQINNLNYQLSRNNQTISNMQIEIKEKDRVIGQKQSQNETIKQTLKAEKQLLRNKLKSEFIQSQQKIQDQLHSLQADIRNLKSQLKQKDSTITKLQKNLQQKTNMLIEKQSFRTRQTAELSTDQSPMEEILKAQMQRLQKKTDAFQLNVETLRLQITRKDQTIANYQQTIAEERSRYLIATNNLKSENEELAEERSRYLIVANALKSENENLLTENQKVRNELRSLKGMHQIMKNSYQTLKNDSESLNVNARTLKNGQEVLRAENTTLMKSNKQLKSQTESLKSELTRLRSQIQTLIEKNRQKSNSLTQMETNMKVKLQYWGQKQKQFNQRLREETSKYQGEIIKYQGEISKYQGEISKYQGEISKCHGEISKCHGEISKCHGEIKQLKTNLQKHNLQSEQLNIGGKQLNNKISQLEEQVYRLKKEIVQKDAINQDKQIEIQNINSNKLLSQRGVIVEELQRQFNQRKQQEVLIRRQNYQIQLKQLQGKISKLIQEKVYLETKLKEKEKSILSLEQELREKEKIITIRQLYFQNEKELLRNTIQIRIGEIQLQLQLQLYNNKRLTEETLQINGQLNTMKQSLEKSRQSETNLRKQLQQSQQQNERLKGEIQNLSQKVQSIQIRDKTNKQQTVVQSIFQTKGQQLLHIKSPSSQVKYPNSREESLLRQLTEKTNAISVLQNQLQNLQVIVKESTHPLQEKNQQLQQKIQQLHIIQSQHIQQMYSLKIDLQNTNNHSLEIINKLQQKEQELREKDLILAETEEHIVAYQNQITLIQHQLKYLENQINQKSLNLKQKDQQFKQYQQQFKHYEQKIKNQEEGIKNQEEEIKNNYQQIKNQEQQIKNFQNQLKRQSIFTKNIQIQLQCTLNQLNEKQQVIKFKDQQIQQLTVRVQEVQIRYQSFSQQSERRSKHQEKHQVQTAIIHKKKIQHLEKENENNKKMIADYQMSLFKQTSQMQFLKTELTQKENRIKELEAQFSKTNTNRSESLQNISASQQQLQGNVPLTNNQLYTPQKEKRQFKSPQVTGIKKLLKKQMVKNLPPNNEQQNKQTRQNLTPLTQRKVMKAALIIKNIEKGEQARKLNQTNYQIMSPKMIKNNIAVQQGDFLNFKFTNLISNLIEEQQVPTFRAKVKQSQSEKDFESQAPQLGSSKDQIAQNQNYPQLNISQASYSANSSKKIYFGQLIEQPSYQCNRQFMEKKTRSQKILKFNPLRSKDQVIKKLQGEDKINNEDKNKFKINGGIKRNINGTKGISNYNQQQQPSHSTQTSFINNLLQNFTFGKQNPNNEGKIQQVQRKETFKALNGSQFPINTISSQQVNQVRAKSISAMRNKLESLKLKQLAIKTVEDAKK